MAGLERGRSYIARKKKEKKTAQYFHGYVQKLHCSMMMLWRLMQPQIDTFIKYI